MAVDVCCLEEDLQKTLDFVKKYGSVGGPKPSDSFFRYVQFQEKFHELQSKVNSLNISQTENIPEY